MISSTPIIALLVRNVQAGSVLLYFSSLQGVTVHICDSVFINACSNMHANQSNGMPLNKPAVVN